MAGNTNIFHLTQTPELSNTVSGSLALGPLTLNWSSLFEGPVRFDEELITTKVSVTLMGEAIGQATIVAEQPKATIVGEVGPLKAQVTFMLNQPMNQPMSSIGYHAVITEGPNQMLDRSGTIGL